MIEAPQNILASMPAVGMPPVHRSGEQFSQILDQAAQNRDRAVARNAANQLVSSVFIMPVLASLHDSPFLEPPFAPSFAEKQFQPLLDQHVADRITGASNFSLVDAIVDRLLGPESPPDQGPGVTGTSS
jgi:Rod binding domain-containing protein